MSDPRSRIPSVDALLGAPAAEPLLERFGRDRTVRAIRDAVDAVRRDLAAHGEGRAGREGRALASPADRVDEPALYLSLAEERLKADDAPSLRSVINATGVVLHTNLGRAPLADAAIEAMRVAAAGYTNLELDLEEGVRGSRYTHCVSLLTELTGAEDALVVNNAAGALVLALNTAALGAGVAVSRGELVEIGGGFRIPEVLERAGARLVEVGSTNRTRLADYREVVERGGTAEPRPPASTPAVGALLKVHRSNFRITGFTEEATVAELAGLAREAGVPLIHDLGSGLMMDAATLGLPDEPRARQSLADGADVVAVSGDKLLGGPQAGILVGRAECIARMRRNPLCRALRVDKATLAALEATLRLYRDPARALREIPTLRMLAADATALRARADELAGALRGEGVECDVVETDGAVGGGTFPGVELPSWAVELRGAGGRDVDALAASLRRGDPPVLGRIVDDALRLDARTVLPGQEADLVRRVVEAMGR